MLESERGKTLLLTHQAACSLLCVSSTGVNSSGYKEQTKGGNTV